MQLDKDAIQPTDVPQNEALPDKDLCPPAKDNVTKEYQQTAPWLKGGRADGYDSKTDINEQDSDGSASAFGEFIDNALKNDDHLK